MGNSHFFPSLIPFPRVQCVQFVHIQAYIFSILMIENFVNRQIPGSTVGNRIAWIQNKYSSRILYVKLTFIPFCFRNEEFRFIRGDFAFEFTTGLHSTDLCNSSPHYNFLVNAYSRFVQVNYIFKPKATSCSVTWSESLIWFPCDW